MHAPHVQVSVVMPGHIGTDIVINTQKLLARDEPGGDADEIARTRQVLKARGVPTDAMSDHDVRNMMQMFGEISDKVPSCFELGCISVLLSIVPFAIGLFRRIWLTIPISAMLSVVAWVLAQSGLPTDAIHPPAGGRAPGWQAGLVTARRQQPGDERIGPRTSSR